MIEYKFIDYQIDRQIETLTDDINCRCSNEPYLLIFILVPSVQVQYCDNILSVNSHKISTSSQKLLKQFWGKWRGSKYMYMYSTSSTRCVCFWLICHQRKLAWPTIFWNIFNFSSAISEQILMQLDRKQVLNILYNVFWSICQQRWPLWPLICYKILYFSSATTEQIWQNFTGSKYQPPLPILCFMVRSVNKDGHPCFWLADTLATFPLQQLFNKTWLEASTQTPLPSLCFHANK